MLTIGIWAIVIILLIVHWDKIAPVAGIAVGVSIVLALIALIGGLIWWGVLKIQHTDPTAIKQILPYSLYLLLPILGAFGNEGRKSIRKTLSEDEMKYLAEKNRQRASLSRKNLATINTYPWYKRWWHTGKGTAFQNRELK